MFLITASLSFVEKVSLHREDGVVHVHMEIPAVAANIEGNKALSGHDGLHCEEVEGRVDDLIPFGSRCVVWSPAQHRPPSRSLWVYSQSRGRASLLVEHVHHCQQFLFKAFPEVHFSGHAN